MKTPKYAKIKFQFDEGSVTSTLNTTYALGLMQKLNSRFCKSILVGNPKDQFLINKSKLNCAHLEFVTNEKEEAELEKGDDIPR